MLFFSPAGAGEMGEAEGRTQRGKSRVICPLRAGAFGDRRLPLP
jgi:hypothetical protein